MPPRLALLGSPAVLDGGRREDVPVLKPAYLLLYLAGVEQWVSRDDLTRVFRPGGAEAATRGNLRLLLTRARRLRWAAGVEAEPQRLRWRVDTDVAELRRALAERDWHRATEGYPAPLLHGWPTDELPGFHEWLEAERAALHGAWLEAVVRREDDLLRRGAFDEAARLLGRALTHDPLSEDVLQRLLRASHLAGARDEALRTYERFAARLRADLGLTPLRATLDLVDALRRDAPPPRPDGAEAPATLPLDLVRPPTLSGRAAEVALLRGAGSPVVLVTGEPGVGKTRLLAEVLPGARPLRCQEGLEHVPYFPLLAGVRARLPELPDLGPYAPDLARFVPEACPEGDGPPPGDGDADSGKVRFLEALARVFAPEGVVVVDDLQWADPATLEWLVFLVRRGGVRLFGAYRGGEVGEALEGTLRALAAQTTPVPLAPLPEAGVAALVGSVTGPGAGPGDLAAWLYPRSGGNPLFVLEWLRVLVQEGVYEARPGAWQRRAGPTDLDALPLTPRLADLVLRRADTLPEAKRRVLDVASVLGGVLDPAHLARVLGEGEWAVVGALESAGRLGLLRGERFAHDVVRRALYAALPQARRRFVHGRAARALEGTLDDLVVAEHARLAGDEASAARLWFRAARFAFGVRRGFEDEATALYERVLGLGVRTPEWYRAHAYLAVRRRVAGRAGEARDLIQTVLRESGDPAARALAHAEGATLAYMDGNLAEAAALVALAAREASPLDDPGLKRDVLLMQANIAHYRGEYAEALGIAEGVVAAARREPLSLGFCNWLSLLGALLCDVGRFEEALALYREQLEAARFLGARSEQVKASSDIIATLHDLGRIQEGVPLAEAALSLGHFNDSYPLRYHLALAYCRAGRLDPALDHTHVVLRGSPSVNMRAHAHALLAEIHDRAGRGAETQAALEGGLTEVEGCDVLTARAVVVIAALQFGGAGLLARARPILAELREDALPAYLRPDFVTALAARRDEAGS
ncbi:ATP-binding protein [Deinococcus aestuarii]|uniref:ATP-binding protein n=1 Tax=Deinococcus aestuarii TaxID=2774531 RepID=UPI001C0BF710|nr:AAA family ATPase [Deinococcus aestuarii]